MDIQIPQILFQIINFSVVTGALIYLLYKPIQTLLEERARRVEEGQLAAQKNIAEQQKLEELKKEVKRSAEKEAAEILEKAKVEADQKAQDMLNKAQEHAKAQILKFQSEWQEQKKELVKQLKDQFITGVVATTEKVVGKAFDKKAHQQLIDDELAQLITQL